MYTGFDKILYLYNFINTGIRFRQYRFTTSSIQVMMSSIPVYDFINTIIRFQNVGNMEMRNLQYRYILPKPMIWPGSQKGSMCNFLKVLITHFYHVRKTMHGRILCRPQIEQEQYHYNQSIWRFLSIILHEVTSKGLLCPFVLPFVCYLCIYKSACSSVIRLFLLDELVKFKDYFFFRAFVYSLYCSDGTRLRTTTTSEDQQRKIA